MKANLFLLACLAGYGPMAAQITIQSGCAVTITGNLEVAIGDQTLANTGSIDAGGATLYLGGNFANTGTFAAGTSTVVFNGAANQQADAAAFYNLTVNKPTPLADSLRLGGDVSVSNVLAITDGWVNTRAYKLTLGPTATVSGEGNSGYVTGRLESSRTVNANVVNFGGMGVVIDASGTGNNLGAVTVSRRAGVEGLNTSYIQNGSGQKSIDRIWSVSPTNQPTTSVDVTLTWLPDNDNGNTDFSAAQIWKSSDGGTTWGPVGPIQSATGRTITATFTGFSIITVGATGSSFPVEWLSFTATPRGAIVHLDWATGSEQNNAYFTAERSINGVDFEAIGQIAAIGNSSSPTAYTYPDANLPQNTDVLYYRIRQTDVDGNSSHSEIRTVVIDQPSGLVAWPNPANNVLYVRTMEEVSQIVLYDAAGRKARAMATKSSETLAFDLSDLAAGVYTLRAGTASLKVVKD